MYNEIEKEYEERMNRLTEKEKIILELVLELSKSLRQEIYATNDKNLFLRKLKNIGKVELEDKSTGEILKIRSKSIRLAFKKFKKMRLIKMDQDSLPIFFPDVMPLLS